MNKDMEELRDFIECDFDSGIMYWKKSPARHVKIGYVAGSVRADNYARIRLKGKDYLAHRVLFYFKNGYLPDQVDHINGNPSDNRAENLRAASHSQNMHNQKLSRSNRSGIKGVHWSSRSNKWKAAIKKNGKIIQLGLYDDLELAELVIQEAREKLHGEFARHN